MDMIPTEHFLFLKIMFLKHIPHSFKNLVILQFLLKTLTTSVIARSSFCATWQSQILRTRQAVLAIAMLRSQ
ncbi:MAG TPA: hypothetical protein VEC36_07055 [Patescibacteria group bacterium]|nr:hypothetical protein [Patescibacteria group bacterium]